MKIRKNKTNILLSFLVALAAWCFTACDDTMGGVTTPTLVFPADTTFYAEPGDTVLVPFKAVCKWNIKSDKGWCRIDGEKMGEGGKAGEYTIAFVVSDEGDLFVDNVATITLHMEGQSRDFASIVRSASKKYTVDVSCAEDVFTADSTIVFGTSGKVVLDVAPNFNIDKLNYEYPEWIELNRVGKVLTLNVKEDSLKYAIDNADDSLRLFKDSTYNRCFHVEYVGMDPREIFIKSQLEESLIVSRDAKRAHIGDTKSQMPVSFSVTAFNDEYEIIALNSVKNVGDSILVDSARWFVIDDDHCGKIALSVTQENNGKDRTADIFALPQPIADELNAAGEESVIDFFYDSTEGLAGIKEEAKKYFLAQVIQDGEYDITITPGAQWGLKVAVDGRTYMTPTSSSTGVSLDAPVTATIETYRGYHLLHVSYDSEAGCAIIPEDNSWLDVVDDGQGNVEVRFARNTGNMRTAYLLALPIALYENTEDLAAELFEVSEESGTGVLELKMDAELYVVAQFIQDADEESSMKVIDARTGWKYLTVVNETDSKWLDMAAGKGIGPRKVFRADLESGSSFLLNPLLDGEVWNPGDSERNDRVEVYGESGTKYEQGVHFSAEPTMMEEEEGEYMLVQFKAFYEIEEEYYIVYFVTGGNAYLKALVVWNYWE